MFTLLKTITLPMPEPQEAIIPWVILAIIITIIGIFVVYSPIKGKSIVFLGPSMSGKSQFLQNLQDGGTFKTKTKEGTSSQEYKAFEVAIGDRTFKIAQGCDRGGRDQFREKLLEEASKSDSWFFFFNAYQYMTDETYAKSIRSYWDNIYHYKSISKEEGYYAIIGTHIDKYLKSSDDFQKMKEDIESSVSNKNYKSLLNHNFVLLDLTSPQMVEHTIKKLLPSIYKK